MSAHRRAKGGNRDSPLQWRTPGFRTISGAQFRDAWVYVTEHPGASSVLGGAGACAQPDVPSFTKRAFSGGRASSGCALQWASVHTAPCTRVRRCARGLRSRVSAVAPHVLIGFFSSGIRLELNGLILIFLEGLYRSYIVNLRKEHASVFSFIFSPIEV